MLQPVSLLIRWLISLAETFVKDNTKISSGLYFPDFNRNLILPTTVVVLPVPAPAITR